MNTTVIHKIEGTGSIITIGDSHDNCRDCRYFVLTASHVSQGKNLEITVGSEKLVPLPFGRLADTRRDIELIEIQKPTKAVPVAFLSTLPDGSQALGTYFQNLGNNLLLYTTSHTIINPFWISQNVTGSVQKPSIHNSFLIIPQKDYCANQQVGENLQSENFESKTPFMESLFGDVLLTTYPIVVAPGMSGAPLFRQHNFSNQLFFFDGITLKFERTGNTTYFAKSESILALLNRYLFKSIDDHLKLEPIFWKSRNGLLYREFCTSWSKCDGSTLEIQPDTIQAGGGVEGDGGSDYGTKNCDKFDPYEKYQILSGLRYKGQNVLGFKIEPNSGGNSVYVEANLAAFDFISKNAGQFKVEPISQEVQLLPLLLNRYKRGGTLPAVPFTVDYSNSNYSLQVFKDHIVINTQSAKYDGYNTEFIHFALDRFGRQLNDQNQPVSQFFKSSIEVRGDDTGTIYYVDIRRLFFINLYRLSKTDSSINPLESDFFSGGSIVIRPKNSLAISRHVLFNLPKTESSFFNNLKSVFEF
ncbi:MAG: hypothetical protein ACXVCY_03410 [Pseudobdellovibrionaceae bacterium]